MYTYTYIYQKQCKIEDCNVSKLSVKGPSARDDVYIDLLGNSFPSLTWNKLQGQIELQCRGKN